MSSLLLCGTNEICLDDKGRITMPSRYRALLKEECLNQCVITRSLFDPCLWLYPKNIWDEVVESLSSLNIMTDDLSRTVRRILLGYACPCSLDAQGRLLLSSELRNIVFLTKKAYLIGLDNKFEIWSEKSYQERQEKDLALLSQVQNNLIDYSQLGSLKI